MNGFDFTPNAKLIGSFIKAKRKEKNLTVNKFLEKNNFFVEEKTVNKWEQGRGIPSLDNLEILSKFFNCSLEEICFPNGLCTRPIMRTKKNEEMFEVSTCGKVSGEYYISDMDVRVHNIISYRDENNELYFYFNYLLEKYLYSWLTNIEKLDFTKLLYITHEVRDFNCDDGNTMLEKFEEYLIENMLDNYKININYKIKLKLYFLFNKFFDKKIRGIKSEYDFLKETNPFLYISNTNIEHVGVYKLDYIKKCVMLTSMKIYLDKVGDSSDIYEKIYCRLKTQVNLIDTNIIFDDVVDTIEILNKLNEAKNTWDSKILEQAGDSTIYDHLSFNIFDEPSPEYEYYVLETNTTCSIYEKIYEEIMCKNFEEVFNEVI